MEQRSNERGNAVGVKQSNIDFASRVFASLIANADCIKCIQCGYIRVGVDEG
jgi:hypothetical protein